jgi:hypothetical protein
MSDATARQSMCYLHDKTAMTMTWFEHEIESELASQFDESVISSFGDDKDALDIRSYSGTACGMHGMNKERNPQV